MKPLESIRVLDLTHMVAGPYATMLMADLGAEVVKVEPPGGEGTRRILADDPQNSVHGMGAYFITLNRNKKSIVLDLKTDAGLETLYGLVRVSDVVIDNYSVGVTERLKIDHARLAAINPRIVTCSITGFGETGPGRDWTSFDMIAQAMSGVMSITGEPDGLPLRSGLPNADLTAGMMAVIGVLSAVVARTSTEGGQHVDISMLDTQISLLSYTAAITLLSGQVQLRNGNAHFLHVPYNTYPVQDGYIVVAVVYDPFWKNLVEIMELPELDTDENLRQPGRLRNRELIERRLCERFASNTKAYWLEQLRSVRIPCAPVNSIAQALEEPQVLARQMVVEVEHPLGDSTRIPGNPVKLSGVETVYHGPPLLGQHTEKILRELLSLSEEKIATIMAAGQTANTQYDS
jgi:CoA:oxalate CoA-transferase